jgi:hypothetical protein
MPAIGIRADQDDGVVACEFDIHQCDDAEVGSCVG